jgi:hypothetical protein
MKEDIVNHNEKGLHHGYQEWYDENGIWYRGNFKNDAPIGYTESNWNNNLGLIGTEVDFFIR